MPEHNLNNLINYAANKRGVIIVIDGGDGSGKALQTLLLMNELNKLKDISSIPLEIGTLDFPQYGKNVFADMTGRYLRGEFGDAATISPYFIIPYFALDRFCEKDTLLQFKNKGNIGVLNRYTTSNLGHQAAKIEDNSEALKCISLIEQMEYDTLGLPRPDLVFYLDVPREIGRLLVMIKKERIYTRGSILDGHESSAKYQEKAASVFRALCEERAPGRTKVEGWVKIECNRHAGENYFKQAKKLENLLLSDFSKNTKTMVRDEISRDFLLTPEEIHEKIDSETEKHFSQL
ncbi:hypothetical protein COT07_02390 [Candidatus Woesearchaeota archaeon CG07_land_8_20_14_0_80_44_23]|nr:MAG: hypothetical protein COT07_02390 [Candidatus Woesearchaeota archaeon CG07_land_8_20_14_0_80_44_23]